MNRIIRVAGLVGLLASAAPGGAFAHAELKHATPAVGSTVQAAPQAVSIDFSEGVEPRFSNITVTDAAGRRVDKGDVHVAPGDNKRLVVDLPKLPPGTYTVTWHAVSMDTHHTQGRFRFTVAP